MTDTDYLDRLTARTQEWREKFPSRAAALRQFARRQLGQPTNLHSAFADRVASDWESQVLCAVMGWPPPEEYFKREELAPPPSVAKAAVIKALDLEPIPLSGRDRAAGKESE